MSFIKIMDIVTANMIAAGEVVERPASVIKELVENAIDAKATIIDISVFGAGRKLIRVRDNGTGMDRDDAINSLKRHASSKLKSKYDLFRITTLGFRGEALPSIASVSKIIMETGDSFGPGTLIETSLEGEPKISETKAIKGTTITVSELFYNTPARLKYLKSDTIENLANLETVQKLTMAYPSVAFNYQAEGKNVFESSGNSVALESIGTIFGFELTKQLEKISFESPAFSIDGFIGRPELNRSSRYYIYTFINNRAVYVPKITRTIIEAYKEYLMPSRYPFVVLYLTVDPTLVDVNVHPSKKEVRLSIEKELIEELEKQLKTKLKEIHPTLTTLSFNGNVGRPFENYNSSYDSNEKVLAPSFQNNSNNGLAHSDINETNDNENQWSRDVPLDSSFSVAENSNSVSYLEPTSSLVEAQNFRLIGQYLETYILFQKDEDLILIDQHAANERINYEKYQHLFQEKQINIVEPLFPLVLEMTTNLLMNFTEAKKDILLKIGLEVEPFSLTSVKILRLPTWLLDVSSDSLLYDIIEQVLKDEELDLLKIQKYAIASVACKASIKANMYLSKESQVALLETLLSCENPANCPHGRPTMIRLTKYEIEKMFKRSGL